MRVIEGNIVDVVAGRAFYGRLFVRNGFVEDVVRVGEERVGSLYVLPGFVDAHVHVESSMLMPSEFAKVAVVYGTVGVCADPHEIANVLGVLGVELMLDNGRDLPFKFFFGVPSCVPATSFETSGAKLGVRDVGDLLRRDDVFFLSEMMNFPGVIYGDNEVLAKIAAAKKVGKRIDGHIPGVKGEDLRKYVASGITTDHECFTLDEARAKIELGMKVQIREGSAAKNFNALYRLIDLYPDSVMLCTDDCHPDDLLKGHINVSVKRAVAKGCDVYKVLKAAILNPVLHYNLPIGLLRKGDAADFILVDNLRDFNVLETVVNGFSVFKDGKVNFPQKEIVVKNKFLCDYLSLDDISVEAKSAKIKVIQAFEGELITKKEIFAAKCNAGKIVSDLENDVLKIVVCNRYEKSKPAVGFIRGFGLKKGAVASSIAHDSHNIVAVGVDDNDIIQAVNRLIDNKGGIVVCASERILDLKLEVAGLISVEDAKTVAAKYQALNAMAANLGCSFNAPFMTLSFMALLVIPEFKISDKGVFDGVKFEFDSIYVDEE